MNMHAREKSDLEIVPKKASNNENHISTEMLEGRARPKENCHYEAANGTQSQGIASIGLMAVRQAAQRNKRTQFTSLMHHITPDLLRRSYFELKRNAAPGIDGMTWHAYGVNLDERLLDLHEKIHKGSYRAKPAKRTYIPKADGSQRPLSIWTVEDKIAQQAMVHILNAIYETDFLGFSYGFRPNRGQHDALDALQVALYRKKINWVLDADIRKFFDQMNQEWVMRFLSHRIRDKRILRLIRKWLRIGVTENGQVIRSDRGTPQGAVVSPVLANIYLHYVFDLWVNSWRKRKAHGDMAVIRYADDTIVGFQTNQDANAFIKDLEERLRVFDLSLHPDKTRLIRFGRFAIEQCREKGVRKPETFDFLGFTHYCTKSYKTGWFVVARKTIGKKMRASLKEIKTELRKRINKPITETGKWLNRVLTGHLNYYAVPGNMKSISGFFYQVSRQWMKMLRRRSQRHDMTWERFSKILKSFIPEIKVIHPQPLHRFDAKIRGRSPVR
jgi:group II intron reverse transcriptase/maturase